MTGFNTMKRSTLVSLIAISLCFVLMLGATWAWFQSTVTNKNNTIAVGTFKLDVVDAEGNSIDNTADGTTVVPLFTATNWAPGSATEPETLTIKNMGTIPMTWKATLVSGTNAVDADLAAKINVTVKQGETTTTYKLSDLLGGQALANGALATTETAEITVTIAMADAGNELMGKTLGFDIVVTADQAR